MQHILTGKVIETVNRRPLNKKQITKLQASSRYELVFKEKFRFSIDILNNGNIFHNYLNTIINSRIQLLDYEMYEYNGKELTISNEPDLIMDEYLRLIELI